MESFVFKDVTYSYPQQNTKALDGISLSVKKGAFTIICGPSGCGKTTLLRQLKTVLTPHGIFSGEILFENMPLRNVDSRTQAKEIGFVLQSPENQVVTDKVWHELAFGLESLGYDTPLIRRRVAEMASFFGIENWFYKNVNELSGGQKQLLSLASVMAMQPSVLVLDEPTSQLDPIAANDFLGVLGKINRELGVTVILTEHRLEEAFPYATQIIVMEKGKIICNERPENAAAQLKEKNSGMFLAMPAPMRIWAGLETELKCPLSVRDGSDFLREFAKSGKIMPLKETLPEDNENEAVLSCRELWFRYEKEAPDIIKGMDFSLKKGEFYALLGGNGTGKTTALKLLSGIRKAYKGSVNARGKIALLPQNPQTLFVKRTVREDLYEIFSGEKIPVSEQDKRVAYVVKLCGLGDFIDRHPYDISGGEQQRTALAKILLSEPQILLLDEPTKGFDAEFKVKFAGILKNLINSGISILMVSHDIVFCSEYAHRCGLFFDGSIVTEAVPRKFFSGNSFYTTPANRMARQLIPEAVTVNDVITCCGGTPAEEEKLPFVAAPALAPPEAESVNYKPEPLPLWRKITAVLCALLSAGIFIYVTNITDLTKLVDSGGITGYAEHQLIIYTALIICLLGFILSVGRRSAPPVISETPKDRRKLGKRTVAAAVMILLMIPLTVFAGVFYFDSRSYNIVSLLVLFESMLPFLLIFEGRKPRPRELVIIAVLCAIGIAGRAVFFMLPQFKPVMALTIIAGVAFGGETGFIVGAVTMLASNVFLSQGPWTPWQMFSMGITGFLAGILFRKGFLRRSRLSLSIFGAVSAIIIYGGIMNFSSAVTVSPESLNLKVLLSYYVTGFPMDLIHAFATFIFLMLAAEPMLEKLDRIKTKYGLAE